MSNEPTITITGNLTGDPELRYTTGGQAYARFVIAATPRRYDRTTNQWTDGETMFLRSTAWRDLAEHIATTVTKGVRVIATGRLRQNTWTTPDGESRWSIDLDVDDLGPSLQWATASVAKVTREPTPEAAPAGAEINSAPTDDQARPVTARAAATDEPPF